MGVFRYTLIWNIYWFCFVSFALLTLAYRGKRDITPERFLFSFAIGVHLLGMKLIFIGINPSPHEILFPNNNLLLFHQKWNINNEFILNVLTCPCVTTAIFEKKKKKSQRVNFRQRLDFKLLKLDFLYRAFLKYNTCYKFRCTRTRYLSAKFPQFPVLTKILKIGIFEKSM